MTKTYEVRIPISVTADSREEAIKFALDDLRDPTMEWTDFEVEEVVTPTTAELRREQAAIDLEDEGWDAVAADVRDGLPYQTILRRLRDLGEEDSNATEIIAEADANE